MQSILEAFARGEILPHEYRYNRNSQYKEAAELFFEGEEKLRTALNTEERKLLDAFMQTDANLTDVSLTEQFIYGYQLGMLMGIEVMERKIQILKEVK